MPVIYELLGYPADDRSEAVEASRRAALCPFTGVVCNGGGNRGQSVIRLDNGQHPELAQYFNGRASVQAGVCSIRKGESEDPWIICPHRLFYIKSGEQCEVPEDRAQDAVLLHCGFCMGLELGYGASCL